jgi:DNA-binding CsgD family transcriptional regulator/PAS domain-containing protein
MTSPLLPDSTVLDLVEHIYCAGCDPTQWRTLVDRVHAALPSTSFSIHLSLDGTTLAESSAIAGMADEQVRAYFEHYQFINPYRNLFETIPVGKVHTVSSLVDRAWLKRQPFFQEWSKPSGNFTHGASLVVLRDPSRLLRMTFDIPEQLAHMETPAAVLFERLGPHLTRAFMVNETFAAASASQQTLSALVEAMAAPAAIVDRNGKVIALNTAAEALLRAGHLMRRATDGRLTFIEPADDAAYRRRLSEACGASAPTGPLAFLARRAGEKPCHIMVLPLRPAAGPAAAPSRGCALVTFRTPATGEAPPLHLLKTLYALTTAEASIAIDMANGLSGEQIAEKNRVSRLTVRNQIASAMAKVGVRRQTQLVSAILGVLPRVGGNTKE